MTTLTIQPLPPHHSAAILATLNRLQPTGAQIVDALGKIGKSVMLAWFQRPFEMRGITWPQFTELVEHTAFPQVLETALTTSGHYPLAARISELVAELDA